MQHEDRTDNSLEETPPRSEDAGMGCLAEIGKILGIVFTWVLCVIIGSLIEPRWGGIAAAAALPLTVQLGGSVVATLLIFMLGARAAIWLLKQLVLLPLRLIRKPKEREPSPLEDIDLALPIAVFAITSFGCGALLGWLLGLLETARISGITSALAMGATISIGAVVVTWLGFEP